VNEPVLPSDLVRALAWLRSRLGDPVDLEALAAAAGVRPRTLEAHFRRHLGTTPLGALRRMRLAHARRELERGARASVTEVALASGFGQLGRFAGSYRALFGESPSATLRRALRAEAGDEPHDEALRLTWQAMEHAFAIAPRECERALDELEKACELAPGLALPLAAAAWCRGQRAAHGFRGALPEERRHSLEAASRACTLGRDDAFALTLASGAMTLAHRLDEADRLLERALALDPWLPYAWVRRGWGSAYAGDADGGLRELRLALELCPVGPMRNIAFIGIGAAHFALERYEAAARWVTSGTKDFPGAVWADRIAAAAAARAGAKDEARRMARRLLRLDPHLSVERARTAWPFPAGFMARLADGLQAAGVPRH
jgi:AraC-like DNA-binding protein